MPAKLQLEGAVWHGLEIVRRCDDDVRYVLAKCSHPGCATLLRVAITNARTGICRKLCDAHKSERATARAAQSLLPFAAVSDKVIEGDSFLDTLQVQVIAYRLLGELSSMRFVLFKREGTVRGFTYISKRVHTERSNSLWGCVCLLCGRYTEHWDAAIRAQREGDTDFEPVRACECMGFSSKGSRRKVQARVAHRGVRERGRNMQDVREVLRVAVRLNQVWGEMERAGRCAGTLNAITREMDDQRAGLDIRWEDTVQGGGSVEVSNVYAATLKARMLEELERPLETVQPPPVDLLSFALPQHDTTTAQDDGLAEALKAWDDALPAPGVHSPGHVDHTPTSRVPARTPDEPDEPLTVDSSVLDMLRPQERDDE